MHDMLLPRMMILSHPCVAFSLSLDVETRRDEMRMPTRIWPISKPEHSTRAFYVGETLYLMIYYKSGILSYVVVHILRWF